MDLIGTGNQTAFDISTEFYFLLEVGFAHFSQFK